MTNLLWSAAGGPPIAPGAGVRRKRVVVGPAREMTWMTRPMDGLPLARSTASYETYARTEPFALTGEPTPCHRRLR
jgi:hypothetical protein